MQNGFIKVAAFSPSIELGVPTHNAEIVISAALEASNAGAHLLVLPRMTLVGETLGELTAQSVMLNAVEKSVERILRATKTLATMLIFGCPVVLGTRIMECAVVALKGEVLGLVPTETTNGVETVRAFGANVPCGELTFAHEAVKSCMIGVSFDPSQSACGATITAVPMATPEFLGASARRIADIKRASRTSGMVLAEAGRGESTTDFVYGGQLLIAEQGEILASLPPLTSGMIVSEIDTDAIFFETVGSASSLEIPYMTPVTETKLTRIFTPEPFFITDEEAKDVLALQARGLAERVRRLTAKCIVIGVSGGLDSTLALLVAEQAMNELARPMTDIIAVTMPCFGTSARTLSQAERLMNVLGVTQKNVSIGRAIEVHFQDIGHDPDNHNATYENAQARERTQVLMDIAGDLGGFVVGTGDLSELALGWTTFNGDHMSMYGVNASIPKTMVRALVLHAVNITTDKDRARVLEDIVATPVSPELLPTQNGEISQITEDVVGPYALHDFFLYHFLAKGATTKKLLRIATLAFRGRYDQFAIKKWLMVFITRFFSSQFKRNCSPDGVAVMRIGLSSRNFDMPSDVTAKTWLDELTR